MKVLIIGFGSIGKRHARIAQESLSVQPEDLYIRELVHSRIEEAKTMGLQIDNKPTVPAMVVNLQAQVVWAVDFLQI